MSKKKQTRGDKRMDEAAPAEEDVAFFLSHARSKWRRWRSSADAR